MAQTSANRMRILFPLATSGPAQQAVPWADRLAAALKAELTLLRVVPSANRPPGSGPDREMEIARAGLAAEADRFPRAKIRAVEVVRGTVAAAIADRARFHDLTLLVGDIRWEETGAVSGTVAAEVIRDSGAPVLVIPSDLASQPPHLPRNVLVPVDGTDRSARIVPLVGELARRLQAAVILFSAIPPKHHGTFLPKLAAHLHKLTGDLRRRQIDTRRVTRQGRPGPAIVSFAVEAQVDLIAMSTAGARDADRPGSVTEYVFAQSRVPVLALYTVEAHAGAVPEAPEAAREMAASAGGRARSPLPIGAGSGTTRAHA